MVREEERAREVREGRGGEKQGGEVEEEAKKREKGGQLVVKDSSSGHVFAWM